MNLVFIRVIIGVLVGSVFQGVCHREPVGLAQMAFCFVLIVNACFQSKDCICDFIEERDIMMYEVAENLYGPKAFIMSCIFIDTVVRLFGVTAQTLVVCAFAGMDWWEEVPNVYFWICMTFLVAESLFLAVAAYCKSFSAADAIANLFMMIFLLFSGFLMSKKSAAPFLQWLLWVTPTSYGVEEVVMALYGDNPTAWAALESAYGFEKHSPIRTLIVMGGMACFFRVLQIRWLTTRNHIQR